MSKQAPVLSQAPEPTVEEPGARTDLAWSIADDIPPGPYPRDSQFFFERVPQLITRTATLGAHGRVLDVACGLGGQLGPLRAQRWEAWGLDSSMALARHCRSVFVENGPAPMVCATAEALPFRSRSFDRIVCQGSLDHFTQPRAFMREVARVLKPDGHAIIGVSNYSSLSCRAGRWAHRFDKTNGAQADRRRNYWDLPPNHTFRGTYQVLRGLGQPDLELVECRGVSLMWLFPAWTNLIEMLPRPIASSALSVADRVAYHMPALADLVVSVWRPRSGTRDRD